MERRFFLTVLILGQLMYFVPSHLNPNNSLEVVLEYEYKFVTPLCFREKYCLPFPYQVSLTSK